MYAELLVNFPDMRGFKSEPVFADDLFNGKLGEVTTTRATRTSEIDPKLLLCDRKYLSQCR